MGGGQKPSHRHGDQAQTSLIHAQHARKMAGTAKGTPDKAKERQATASGVAAPMSPAHRESAACSQCHVHAHVFYCSVCLSERIIAHHMNVRRVDDMREKQRIQVQRSLGIRDVHDESEGVGETSGGIDRQRQLRATQASLHASISQGRQRVEALRELHTIRSRSKQQRLEALRKRRMMLDKARHLSSLSTAQSQGDSFDQQSFPVSLVTVDSLRQSVKALKEQCNAVAKKLAEARAILAREAFALFRVSPPVGSMAAARGEHGGDRARQRSRDRYTPGAFLFDPGSHDRAYRTLSSQKMKAAKPPMNINPNDWSIMDLVLPIPSDATRFECGQINGAITHAIHLIQLLTLYLGTALPFVILWPAGVPQIRPNTMWGSGASHPLDISSSTLQALLASEGKVNSGGGMRASMIGNLGSSTISTLESFIHLPGGGGMPWGKTFGNQIAGGSKTNADDALSPEPDIGSPRSGESVDEKTITTAAKHFYTALTMLAYDVAYIAHLQGVSVDLPSAAGSSLRLLSKAINSPKLGQRAHTTSNAHARVANLTFNQLDFTQLAQISEPGALQKATASLAGAQSRPGERRGQSRGSNAGQDYSPNNAMLDGSYIDARKAAESILIRDSRATRSADSAPSKPLDGTNHRPRPSSTGKTTESPGVNLPETNAPSSPAAKRVTTAGPLPTSSSAAETAKMPKSKPGKLDFLHAKPDLSTPTRTVVSGRTIDATPSSTSTATRPVSGTVMFNGVEVKGTARTDTNKESPTSSRRKAKSHRRDEDDSEWAVV